MKKPEEIKKGMQHCALDVGCDGCLYYDDCVAKDVVTPMLEDAHAYIQQLEAQIPKWISVDSPPLEGGEYIVYAKNVDGKMMRTWDIYHPAHGWCEDVEKKVLYWMSFSSLPEPPKEGE